MAVALRDGDERGPTVSARVLRPGEAVPLADLTGSAGAVRVQITLASRGPVPDLVALMVGENNKVRTDDDLIFYNNPASADGAVRYDGSSGVGETFGIRCAVVDADVTKIVLGCAGGSLENSPPIELTLTVADDRMRVLAQASFTPETTHRGMVLLEVYRRNEQWRCRLLAQGYAAGLAGLVTDFGVQVEEDVNAATTQVAPPVPATSFAPARYEPPAPGPTNYTPPPAAAWNSPPAPQQFAPGAQPPRSRGLFTRRRRLELEAQNAQLAALVARPQGMDNSALTAERDGLTREIAKLSLDAIRKRADLADLERRLQVIRTQIQSTEGEAELHDVGVYRFRHRLEDAVAYKGELEALKDAIKATSKPGFGVTGAANWHVDGSYAKGQTMVKEISKLMLRAYNADADHAVRTMRPYKLDSALTRLDTTRSTITRLGKTMHIEISDHYHQLRRSELELTADYLSKVEQEKERQRELREKQREDRKVEEEIARKQAQLNKEQQRWDVAVRQLEAKGDTSGAIQARTQLTSVNAALAGLAHRRDNLRLGHVYVISNVGAFGHRMVKIGMTRRLEPEDRIRELGDASVPFKFDKHALILSEDAVELENWLHRRFRDRAVNRVNTRREFYYVTPAEVRDALAERDSQFLLEFNETPEASEWHQSDGPERAVLPT